MKLCRNLFSISVKDRNLRIAWWLVLLIVIIILCTTLLVRDSLHSLTDFGLLKFLYFPSNTNNDQTLEQYRTQMNLNRTRCNSLDQQLKIVIVVFVDKCSTQINEYDSALATLKCYAKMWNYEFLVLHKESALYNVSNCKYKTLLFHKHCAVSELLLVRTDINWALVLDADTGVVNQYRCIEHFIKQSANLIFYERFYNWEVASGNYLVKNTKFSIEFLKTWADFEWKLPKQKAAIHSQDNGALQLHLLQTLLDSDSKKDIELCKKLWYTSISWQHYFEYNSCCKLALGSRRLYPHKVYIYRRAHAWVIDRHIVKDRWSPQQFMMHNWKHRDIHSNWPLKTVPVGSQCASFDAQVWPHKALNFISESKMAKILKEQEQTQQTKFGYRVKTAMHFQHPDIGDCWPNC